MVLTTSIDDQDLFEAVKSGASGYLSKSISADTLMEALTQVQEGIPPFSPGLAEKLLREFAHLSESSTANVSTPEASAVPGKSTEVPLEGGLNSRQIEVLTLVYQLTHGPVSYGRNHEPASYAKPCAGSNLCRPSHPDAGPGIGGRKTRLIPYL